MIRKYLLFIFLYPVKGIQFIEEPKDAIVAPGHSVLLDCVAHAEDGSSPNIKWRSSDGQYLMLQPDDNSKTLGNGSLVLSNVFFGQEGCSQAREEYQCVASSEKYGTIVSRTASVIAACFHPLKEGRRNLQVYAGETAFLSCFIDARPKAQILWLKNQYPLDLDPLRMTILPSGSLEIENVQMSDAGSYQCNASNFIGHEVAWVELSVKSADDAESSLMAPVFIATPRSSTAIEGDTVTFECAANGFPRPHITWLKDGVTIDLADLDSTFSTTGSGSLQISKVKEEDQGNYVCRATNKEDLADISATLDVQVPPRFNQEPSTKIAHEKDDVELPCDVYGKPEPKVTWLKNGELINFNEYLQVVHRHNLKISGSLSLDSGIFQCIAKNDAGNIQTAVKLIVLNTGQEIPDLISSEKSSSLAPINPSSFSGEASKPKLQGALPAPRNLRAVTVSRRFVVLQWQPPEHMTEEIDGYAVFYREQGSLRERVSNISRQELGNVNISGLQPDKTYVFTVVGVSSGRLGESSESLTVTTQKEVHVAGPPTLVIATAVSASAILVQWQAPEYANGPVVKYQVFYVEEEIATEHYVETEETRYELTNLAPFSVYTIWVAALNSNGPGINSVEARVRTYSSAPTKPPQSVTAKPFSSSVVTISWEPPPRDGQNGIITGYKIKYKKGDKKLKGEVVVTAGDRRMYSLEDLDRSSVYHIRLWALNVNGSSPPSEWCSVETFENDLIENTVPDAPGSLIAQATSDSIYLLWTPPLDTSIMVRSYTIGWGRNYPDMFTKSLNGRHSNSFTITKLKPNSEYIISLKASNEMGDGPPKYANVRTSVASQQEPALELTPPIGLKASILSPTSAVLYWSDTTLPQGQFVTDDRHYIVRCMLYHATTAGSRTKFYNATDLNLIISDLKPNSQYEFTVKVVKGNRESPWSMVVLNTTLEDAPSSPPMDLTVVPVEGTPSSVTLNWQPPKVPNGRITGYLVSYTRHSPNQENVVEVEKVVGDKMSTVIKNLSANTTYFFQIQARTKGGIGPMSNNISFTTPVSALHQFDSRHGMKDTKEDMSLSSIMYLGIGCGALSLVLIFIMATIFCCRRKSSLDSSKKERFSYRYMKTGTGSKQKSLNTNLKPPDLWIHHDQMELKALEKSSQGSLDTASGGGPSSINLSKEFDVSDHHQETRVHHHTSSTMTNSLDKRNYISSYIAGSPSEQPLLSEEKKSTLRSASKSKPISLQMDRRSASSNSSSDIVEMQPLYPHQHYSVSRAHVTVDATGALENTYIIQSAAPSTYESINNPNTSQPPSTPIQGQTYGTAAESKRLQGHPLKSFSVPAPPPQSAPSTPQQKHVVRSHGSSSPYKKAPPTAGSTLPPGPASTSSTKPWQSDLLQLSKIQPSYSTEELNQEMANLEGLMKDLNAITASEFEC
ncbi:neogenin isoform X4 [Bemisia tabaci]|uniref:neogenin isoform X4 n=1 Tax=Bemisia tabaci TaxID=7038 RepID=UPI003B27E38F